MNDIAGLSPLIVADWMSTLSVERMQMKSERILRIYEACGRDWETTCFHHVGPFAPDSA